ncbi:MAG: anthranilate synthase component II [bacterium]
MILVIDNYDSFTYNLYQYLAQLDEVLVFRNDQITIEDIEKMSPSHIVISPGPGRPDDAGISRNIIAEFKDKVPILGVCLGHQCIAEVFGAEIIKADKPLHGKMSDIYLKGENENDLFLNDINNPFTATRYHSLIVKKESLPEELLILAETSDNIVMALKHKKYPVYGLQFHPESIMTESGMKIIQNFVKLIS